MSYRYIVPLALLGLVLALLLPGVILAQPRIPHTLEGRSACTSCHTVGGPGVGAAGGTGLPADHQGRTDSACTGCHQAAAAAAPAATPTTAAAPAATPTAPAGAAPAATATPAAGAAAPAKPAATATPAPAPGALPRTGGLPVLPFFVGGGTMLISLGWALRRAYRR